MTNNSGLPQPPPQPVYAPPQAHQVPPAQPRPKGLALTALIVGIVAFLLGLVPVLGIILGLVGVAIGIIALVKKQSKGLAVTGLVLAGLALIASIGTTAGLGAAVNSVSDEIEAATVEEVTEEEPAVETPEPEPEPEPAVEPAEEPQLSVGQTNALRSAKSYLQYSGFSRTGLIGQLEYEGFSPEEATFGADNAGADWMAEAAESAQSYIEYSSFSRQGLIDQLLYEGFSQAEAEHGVAAVGY